MKLVLLSFITILSGCNSQPDNIVTTSQHNTNTHPTLAIERSQLLSDLEQLSSDEFSGRKISTIGSIKAQTYIINKLSNYKISPFSINGYLQPFHVNNNEISSWLTNAEKNNYDIGNNIIGLVKGHKYPNSYIVLSAHYDHLGTKGSEIYNGADDNASGVAALLSFAYLIQQTPLAHSVIFLFTDGEEQSLTGASAFATQNQQLLNQIRLNINIDMIAGAKTTQTLHYISYDLKKTFDVNTIEQFESHQSLKNFKVKKGFREKGRSSVVNRQNWHQASDHGIFKRNNIPYIYYGVGTHNNYHTINDTYEHINHQFYWLAVNAIFQQILFLDKN